MKQRRNKKEKGLRSQLHFVAARHLSICSTLHIRGSPFSGPLFFSRSVPTTSGFRFYKAFCRMFICPGQCTIDSLFSCLFASASSNITSDPALPHRPLQLCFDPYHAHRFSLKIPRLLSMIPASLQPLSSASRSLALSITVVSSGSQVPLRLRSFRINSL